MGKISSIIPTIVISLLSCNSLPTGMASAQTTETEPTPIPIEQPDSVAQPTPPEESVKQVFFAMLEAIASNSYEDFIARGNSGFQDAITKEMFEPVSAELASRLNNGYTTTFFGELEQQGYRVYVWKVDFKDEGDDFLARISIKNGKVGGFWIN